MSQQPNPIGLEGLYSLGGLKSDDFVGITQQELDAPAGESLFTFYEESVKEGRVTCKERYFIPAPDHDLPAVPDSDYVPREGLGIDRPPTPFPKMETTLQRQSSSSVYSDKQLETAYRLSPKIPAPDPSDQIFSAPIPFPEFDPNYPLDTEESENVPLHMIMPVRPATITSVPTLEDELPSTSYIPEPTMPSSGVKSGQAPSSSNPAQPHATTARGHALIVCTKLLNNLTDLERIGVIVKLLEDYCLHVGDPMPPIIIRKPGNAGGAKKSQSIVETMHELGKDLDRIDLMAKENNRQMREALCAFQAENAAATAGAPAPSATSGGKKGKGKKN